MADFEVSVEVTCPHCNKTWTEETTVEIDPSDAADDLD